MRLSTGLRGMGGDFRFAARALRKRPGLSALAVLSLALGIGANAAVFSLVEAVLLRSLPYREPDRLVRIWETFPFPGGRGNGTASVPNLVDWRAGSRSFAGLDAWSSSSFTLLSGDEPLHLTGAAVSAGLFDLLGVQPVRGRVFRAGEDRPSAAPVVVLGHALWQKRFAADPAILGRALTIDGTPHTVIGVMPPEFELPPRSGAELWLPLIPSEAQRYDRGWHWISVLGRLVPGASLDSARNELSSVAERLARDYPDAQRDRGVRLEALPETVVGRIRPVLLALWGAVGLVLLIGCANVANLLLAAATARRREMAVRAAVGASRWHLVRQTLAESVLLTASGAVLGLLLGLWALHRLAVLPGTTLPSGTEVGPDLGVLMFSLAVSALAAFASGLAPALRAARSDLQTPLRQGAAAVGHGSGRDRVRSGLVVAEMALALVVLVGAGLLWKNLVQLQSVESGLDPTGVLTFRLELPETRYTEPGDRAAFFRRLEERLRSLSGVSAVGGINMLPLQRWGANGTFVIEGRPPATSGDEPFSELRQVTPGYFEALGVPLESGRLPSLSDDAAATTVTVVNHTLAARYWPGEDPVGRRLSWNDPPSEEDWLTVIGVVGDVRDAGLHQDVRPEMYVPLAQAPTLAMSYAVRAVRDPRDLVPEVRQAVRALDPELPVFEWATMDEVISGQIATWRFNALLLGVFAAIAVVLALGGVYGVLAFAVGRRGHELALRMALGANKGGIVLLVLRQGLVLVVLGAGLGLGLSTLATRLLANQLLGVAPTDPETFGGMTAVLIAVAVLATLLPARRAMRVEPVVALKEP